MSHDYYLDPADLDEFLVEYVDGTMDPVVREAFEEFMRVYPEVRAHVDCLASVRTELCKLGDDCRCHAPPGFQDRLKRELACEEMSESGALVLENWAPQLNMIALAFSISLLVMAVGLTRGSSENAFTEANGVESEKVVLQAVPENLASELLEGPILGDAGNAEWSFSNAHQVLMTSSLATVSDRPMLMSVRRDFVAMKPAMLPIAP
jgi:hypothetical protein